MAAAFDQSSFHLKASSVYPFALPTSLRAFIYVAASLTGLSLSVALLETLLRGRRRGLQGLWLDAYSFDFYDYIPRYLHRHTLTFYAMPGYMWYYPAPAIFVHLP